MEIKSLKHYRTTAKLTQDELAAKTKLASSTIHRIEIKGRCNKGTASLIAKALGIKAELLGQEPPAKEGEGA